MRWIQWMRERKPGKIHATYLGQKTLCGWAIPTDLLHDEATPPKDDNICLICKKVEAEMGLFGDLPR